MTKSAEDQMLEQFEIYRPLRIVHADVEFGIKCTKADGTEETRDIPMFDIEAERFHDGTKTVIKQIQIAFAIKHGNKTKDKTWINTISEWIKTNHGTPAGFIAKVGKDKFGSPLPSKPAPAATPSPPAADSDNDDKQQQQQQKKNKNSKKDVDDDDDDKAKDDSDKGESAPVAQQQTHKNDASVESKKDKTKKKSQDSDEEKEPEQKQQASDKDSEDEKEKPKKKKKKKDKKSKKSKKSKKQEVEEEPKPAAKEQESGGDAPAAPAKNTKSPKKSASETAPAAPQRSSGRSSTRGSGVVEVITDLDQIVGSITPWNTIILAKQRLTTAEGIHNTQHVQFLANLKTIAANHPPKHLASSRYFPHGDDSRVDWADMKEPRDLLALYSLTQAMADGLIAPGTEITLMTPEKEQWLFYVDNIHNHQKECNYTWSPWLIASPNNKNMPLEETEKTIGGDSIEILLMHYADATGQPYSSVPDIAKQATVSTCPKIPLFYLLNYANDDYNRQIKQYLKHVGRVPSTTKEVETTNDDNDVTRPAPAKPKKVTAAPAEETPAVNKKSSGKKRKETEEPPKETEETPAAAVEESPPQQPKKTKKQPQQEKSNEKKRKPDEEEEKAEQEPKENADSSDAEKSNGKQQKSSKKAKKNGSANGSSGADLSSMTRVMREIVTRNIPGHKVGALTGIETFREALTSAFEAATQETETAKIQKMKADRKVSQLMAEVESLKNELEEARNSSSTDNNGGDGGSSGKKVEMLTVANSQLKQQVEELQKQAKADRKTIETINKQLDYVKSIGATLIQSMKQQYSLIPPLEATFSGQLPADTAGEVVM